MHAFFSQCCVCSHFVSTLCVCQASLHHSVELPLIVAQCTIYTAPAGGAAPGRPSASNGATAPAATKQKAGKVVFAGGNRLAAKQAAAKEQKVMSATQRKQLKHKRPLALALSPVLKMNVDSSAALKSVCKL